MSHHTFPWQEAFLAALREFPVLKHGCDAAGINRSTVFRARQANEDFDKAVNEAMEEGIDRAEQEAFRRGVVGFLEPVVHQGQLQFTYERYLDDDGKEAFRKVLDANGQPIPLTVRKHSDPMLALILKGRRKTVYAERTEVTGANGGPVASQALTVVTGVPLNPADQAPEDFA
jgi:hypothetical protein